MLEVQEHFGLPGPALVEKDWYVVKALAAIAAVDAGDFRLVFGGGTALSRAYRLTKRMSEDVDLKIVCETKLHHAARCASFAQRHHRCVARRRFRVRSRDEKHRLSMYKGHYTKYQLPYKPIAEGKGILRPDVQIETSVWPLRREAVDRPVSSFIAEAYGREPELATIACSSVLETAAEKLVGVDMAGGL